jgi:phosphate acetyltransferase
VLALLRHRYGVPVPYDRLYGVTYPEAAALLADGRGDDLVSRVVERYRALSDECDAVVVIGSDLDQEGMHL